MSKSIMQQMNEGKQDRINNDIREREILRLELRLIYAKDFTPHKVEYYEQRIKEAKKLFK